LDDKQFDAVTISFVDEILQEAVEATKMVSSMNETEAEDGSKNDDTVLVQLNILYWDTKDNRKYMNQIIFKSKYFLLKFYFLFYSCSVKIQSFGTSTWSLTQRFTVS